MSRFEDRLWSELVALHSTLAAEAPPAGAVAVRRRRAPRARLVARVAVLAAVLAATLAILSTFNNGASTPAYAVTQNRDGSVTVTIDELVGVDGANGQLAALGVPIRVAAPEAGCQVPPGRFRSAPLMPELRTRLYAYVSQPQHGVKIDPALVPAGDTLLLAAREGQSGVVLLSVALYRGPAPACLPLRPGPETAP